MGPVPIPSGVSEMPVLHGERLVLRGFHDADCDALYGVFSDPEVMRYWSRVPMADRSEAVAQLAANRRGFDERTHLCWAIATRDDDALIGTATLFAFRIDQGRCEIGYALSSSHWGRGYAREALTLVVDHAFDALGMNRIEADIDPRNQGSIALVERLGFEREGLLRERWRVGGQVQDSAIYGLLRSDWR